MVHINKQMVSFPTIMRTMMRNTPQKDAL